MAEPIKTLHRSETNKVIAGVAGGLGEYFDVDPTLIRAIFIILTVLHGSGILIYLILWIIMPGAKQNGISESQIKENISEMKEKAQKVANDLKAHRYQNRSHYLLGLLVIGLGILFLLENFGVVYGVDLAQLWPILLIFLGLALLLRR